jgi:hypothetical protein
MGADSFPHQIVEPGLRRVFLLWGLPFPLAGRSDHRPFCSALRGLPQPCCVAEYRAAIRFFRSGACSCGAAHLLLRVCFGTTIPANHSTPDRIVHRRGDRECTHSHALACCYLSGCSTVLKSRIRYLTEMESNIGGFRRPTEIGQNETTWLGGCCSESEISSPCAGGPLGRKTSEKHFEAT